MSKIVRASTLYVVCLSHGFPADLPGALKPLSCPFSTRLSFFFRFGYQSLWEKIQKPPILQAVSIGVMTSAYARLMGGLCNYIN